MKLIIPSEELDLHLNELTNLFITENARFWFLYRTLKIDIGLQFLEMR